MNSEFLKRSMSSHAVRAIAAKITEGQRITADDAAILLKQAETGELAMLVAENPRKNMLKPVKKRVLHLIHGDSCKYSCHGCIIGENDDLKAGLSSDEILNKIENHPDLQELQISAGIHEYCREDDQTVLLNKIKYYYPQLPLRFLNAIHLHEMAENEGKDLTGIVARLRSAGLEHMFGGDALIARTQIRDKLQDYDLSMEQWLEYQKVIHNHGVGSDATMVYGHFESLEDRIRHLELIRELQDKTGGFELFTPVKLRDSHDRQNYFPAPSGIEDMRVFALSSLFLDNIDYINVQSIVGEEGWEQVFHFGGNYIPAFLRSSQNFMPQYGKIYTREKSI